MTIHQLCDMGGYGRYVWSAYSIALVVFSFNILVVLQERKQIKKILRHYLTRTRHE